MWREGKPYAFQGASVQSRKGIIMEKKRLSAAERDLLPFIPLDIRWHPCGVLFRSI